MSQTNMCVWYVRPTDDGLQTNTNEQKNERTKKKKKK